VYVFDEFDRVRFRHPLHRPHQTTFARERTFAVFVQNAHDRPTLRRGAFDQLDDVRAERRHVFVAPIVARRE
jgi:hypothetical protein